MNKPHTLIRLILLTACFMGGLLVLAAPIDADSKVLIIGPAADTHKTALQGLIAGDATASGLNITVDSFQTNDLWNSFFTNSNGWFSHPSYNLPLQAKLNEGFDVILVNPGERHIRISPELHMEGVRMLERHVRNQGSRIFLMVPTFDPSYPEDRSNPSTSTDVKERVYRIADAFEFSAIPVGICWDTVLADGSISSTDTSMAAPNTHAANTYSTTIFSALFETSAAASSYRHGGISGAEFSQIAAHAHQTWQDALTATHYTGDYVGFFSPMPFVFDAANRPHYWSGASTEAMTMREMQSIYQRKGEHMVTGDTKTSPNWSKGYQFWVHNDHILEENGAIDVVEGALGLTYAVRDLEQLARAGLSRAENGGLNWYHRVDNPEWGSGGYVWGTYTYEPGPKVSKVPNMIGYTRYYADFPNQRAKKHGDGHLNDNLTMMQSAMIYTMVSGGQNPLEDVTDLDGWTGPQRYAAALGYVTVMGIGRLQKLEMAPVAVGKPRYHVTANTAKSLTLPGYDFDGLPLTVEILTPPAHGSLVPNGDDFIYTPDTDFSGIDTVTYRVSNGTDTSLPLTVYLPVTPYIPSPVTGTVFFEDNFDDKNIDGWDKSGTIRLVDSIQTGGNPKNGIYWIKGTLVDGFQAPFDGDAGFMLDSWGANLRRAVDTTGFENLLLTIRVGSGSKSIEDSHPDQAQVEWYDGSTWHTLISHDYTYLTNRLLVTYEVSLPQAAAMNPDFRLRLSKVNVLHEAFFDSIRLSGDVVQLPPEANDLEVEVATNTPWPITLEASDINSADTLSYSYSQPSHGTLSGTAPNLTYTSDTAYSGPDSFTYTANDGTSDSNVATVTINVRNNTAPEVDAGPNQSVSFVSSIPNPTGGAGILLDATADDGLNTTWEDSVGPWDLTLDGGVSLVTDAGNGLPEGSSAYAFPGGVSGGGGASGSSFASLGWNDQPVTLEIWFKPDSTADDGQTNGQVLFETGGGTGLGVFYNDGAIEIGHDTTEVISSVDVSALADRFLQVVLSYDVTGTDDCVLYVNGSQAAVGNRSDTDWSGSDDAGLGARGGDNVGGRGSGDSGTESFAGQIAIFRAYQNTILSPEEVQTNYQSVVGGQQATAQMNPTVSDLDGDPLTYLWTKLSGPGDVTFADETAADTSVFFTDAGIYVLRLTVDDRWEVSFDDVTITVTETMIDSDNDGLDDDWELAHFETLGDTDGTGDADGDGVKDFWEYITGTDPNVADANLLALGAGPSAHGPASVFKWTVKDGFVAGQHYQVLYSTDLSGWTPLPQEHYTLTPTVVNGMNEVEMDVTYDYGPHIFITLDQP